MYRDIIAVCSEIHTKHINTLCEQNVELLNVKPGGTLDQNRANMIASLATPRDKKISQKQSMVAELTEPMSGILKIYYLEQYIF